MAIKIFERVFKHNVRNVVSEVLEQMSVCINNFRHRSDYPSERFWANERRSDYLYLRMFHHFGPFFTTINHFAVRKIVENGETVKVRVTSPKPQFPFVQTCLIDSFNHYTHKTRLYACVGAS